MLTDADHMARAVFLAGRGRGRTSPNPMVGAVVVSPDGIVVGWGFHARAGEAHAEVHALEMAGVRARGGTLYCTLEPCSHAGRTGPCAPRVAEAGIARVVAAIEDPDPRVQGQGFALLRSRGVAVEVGLGADAASELNQPYLTRVREGRPFVILKAAISADGCIAEGPGVRTRLTSARADRHAHQLRAEIDAIGVGSGTIRIDDPWLTARGVYRARPLTRVIFDRSLATPPSARVLSTLAVGPVIIVTTAQAAAGPAAQDLRSGGAQIAVVDAPGVRGALEHLAAMGTSSLLLEGGARIHGAAWDEGVVDMVRLYVAPVTLGAGGLRFLEGRSFQSTDLVERRTTPLGPDTLIEGYVHGPR